jgi:putative ABC transport system permease protein
MLARSPGFTAVVLVTLALGIGANTAIFSVVNAVLLRPMPYGDADKLVGLYRQQKKDGAETNSYAKEFLYWRQNNRVFEQIGTHGSRRVYLTGLDRPRQVEATVASACIFSLLRAQPLLGRGFLPEEDQPGQDRVVVLSHAFWRDQWAGDPNVLGKSLCLDNENYTIVGVMPAGFQFPLDERSLFWMPEVLRTSRELGYEMSVSILARLQEGVSFEKARAQMALLAEQFERVEPRLNKGYTVTVHRYLDRVLGDNRRILLLLLGAAGLVLLIACSNVANLLLARATLRQREIGVRVALGASRGRIMRQVLTESILWSVPAGLLGLPVAYWIVKGLIGLCPSDIPRIGETRVDATVLGFTLGLSILTGLAFSVLPARRASDIHTGQFLKEGQVRSPTGGGWQRLRDGLVVAQIGTALTLLLGAALLVQTIAGLGKADLGFRPQSTLLMRIELPQIKYPQDHQREAFFNQLLQAVRAVPDVRSAALISVRWSAAVGNYGSELIAVGASPPSDPEEFFQVHDEQVGRDFFETVGIPVLKGRAFTEQDIQAGATSPNEPLIIDEALARKYFPNADPVGQRIHFRGKTSGIVVGVVATARNFEDLAAARGMLYRLLFRWYYYTNEIVVRTQGDPLRAIGALRAQVQGLDREQVCEFRTVASALTKMLGPRRFSMWLLSLFAGTALLLAATGIYGLLQYLVAQQTHDIGIRMALGARKEDVLKATLGQGLRLILLGIAVGLGGALVLTRLIASLLYGVTRTDPMTFVCVSLVLTGVAALACYLPARRAARTDPMAALRCE